MNPDMKNLLFLARQLAIHHIEDGDILGKWARELLELIDFQDSSIQSMERAEDA